MAASEVTLETLQKVVDGFGMDVGRVRATLADEKTPVEAQAILLGGLNYVLDSWDMLPDHYPASAWWTTPWCCGWRRTWRWRRARPTGARCSWPARWRW
jgi:hypothetical protein